MDHHEMVALIVPAVTGPGGTWADLGAGTGNFTRALAELLGPAGTIYALDRDLRAITAQRARLLQDPPPATIIPRQVDITQKLALASLDGVLLANVLHFVQDQPKLLAQIRACLKPQGRLLVVEYEVAHLLRWVPYPLPFERFVALVQATSFASPTLVGQRRSPSSGIVLYAAVATSGN